MEIDISNLKLVSSKEVANVFGVHERTVKRLAISGELPGYFIKNQWRFDPEDVKKYLIKHRSPSK